MRRRRAAVLLVLVSFACLTFLALRSPTHGIDILRGQSVFARYEEPLGSRVKLYHVYKLQASYDETVAKFVEHARRTGEWTVPSYKSYNEVRFENAQDPVMSSVEILRGEAVKGQVFDAGKVHSVPPPDELTVIVSSQETPIDLAIYNLKKFLGSALGRRKMSVIVVQPKPAADKLASIPIDSATDEWPAHLSQIRGLGTENAR